MAVGGLRNPNVVRPDPATLIDQRLISFGHRLVSIRGEFERVGQVKPAELERRDLSKNEVASLDRLPEDRRE